MQAQFVNRMPCQHASANLRLGPTLQPPPVSLGRYATSAAVPTHTRRGVRSHMGRRSRSGIVPASRASHRCSNMHQNGRAAAPDRLRPPAQVPLSRLHTWLRVVDSNHHSRIQSPVSYRWTNPDQTCASRGTVACAAACVNPAVEPPTRARRGEARRALGPSSPQGSRPSRLFGGSAVARAAGAVLRAAARAFAVAALAVAAAAVRHRPRQLLRRVGQHRHLRPRSVPHPAHAHATRRAPLPSDEQQGSRAGCAARKRRPLGPAVSADLAPSTSSGGRAFDQLARVGVALSL